MADNRKDIARELARRYGVLSTEGLDRLADILVPMKVSKGKRLLNEGEVCRHLYYVEHGIVRQVYVKNGKELTEHIAYEGGIVMCIESLFRHAPSILAVEALEPSLVYGIPYDSLIALCRTSFEYCAFIIAILQESLIVSQRKADTLRFETAKERYLRTLHDHPNIVLRTPLHIVASYLQMTPETLSRVRTATSEEPA